MGVIRSSRAWACVAAALGTLASAPPAVAQNERPKVEPPVELNTRAFERAVAELDAEDLTTRELATERLAALPALSLDDVLSVLIEDASLTPEQRNRLERVSTRLFMSAPKAGLGVEFGRFLATRGVQIEPALQPNVFPAAAILESGDFIHEVHGQRVMSPDFLRAVILSHRPGEVMPTVVLRGPDRLELDLPLGNFEQLGRTRSYTSLARQCVRLRLDRMGDPAEPPAIGAGLGAADWAAAAGADGGGTPPPMDDGPGVAVGGSPRLDPTGSDAGTPLGALLGVPERPDPSALTPEQRLERIIELRRRGQRLLDMIGELRGLRSDPTNSDEETERIDERISDLRSRKNSLDSEINALRDHDAEP